MQGEFTPCEPEELVPLGDRSGRRVWTGERLKYDETLEKTTETKRRPILQELASSVLRVTTIPPTGPPTTVVSKTDNSGNKSLNGTQYTVSENHPNWGRKRKKRPFSVDDGGPFFMQKRYAVVPGGGHRSLSTSVKDGQTLVTTTCQYEGCMLPTGDLVGGGLWPAFAHSSNAQLDAAGTTAIARCKPAQPTASIANALIELKREGLPKLAGLTAWEAQTKRARRRAPGDEFLNFEFGFKPLANDIADLAMFMSDSERLLKQYIRDAGKQIRRSYEFPPSVVESDVLFRNNVSPSCLGPTSGAMYNFQKINTGRVVRHRTVSKRVWFKGAFIYHLPIDLDTMSEMIERRDAISKMIGLDLTPDVIWNSAPWSWAIDWFVNLGDVISNLQSWTTDGMVLRYGYVMEHTMCTDTYSFHGETGFRAGGSAPGDVSLICETKQRRKATPFGFGKTWGAFTARQLSIIAALGISRS
jgi:hypothetical protein